MGCMDGEEDEEVLGSDPVTHMHVCMYVHTYTHFKKFAQQPDHRLSQKERERRMKRRGTMMRRLST